jgi:hypothetical protein
MSSTTVPWKPLFGEELKRHVDDLLASAGAQAAHDRAGVAQARPAERSGSAIRPIGIAFGSMSPSFRTARACGRPYPAAVGGAVPGIDADGLLAGPRLPSTRSKT